MSIYHWRLGLTEGYVSGELKIAEVASRFSDVGEFESLVASLGFRLTSKVRRIYAVAIAHSHALFRTTATPTSLFLTGRRHHVKQETIRRTYCCPRAPCSSPANTSAGSFLFSPSHIEYNKLVSELIYIVSWWYIVSCREVA